MVVDVYVPPELLVEAVRVAQRVSVAIGVQ